MSYIDYGPTKCIMCGGFHSIGITCPTLNIGELFPTCGICGQYNTLANPCGCQDYKDDCLGRSQHKCKYCGKCLGLFEACGCQLTSVQSTSTTTSAPTLEDLYNDLGTLKWRGEDKGWNEAIEAVRKHIREKLR